MSAVKICASKSVAEALERMTVAQTQLITVYESRDVITGVLLRAEAEGVSPDVPVGSITRRLLRYGQAPERAA
jgi:hypothetical protein